MGFTVGAAVGSFVGASVGLFVGEVVGDELGEVVGEVVGIFVVGEPVGFLVVGVLVVGVLVVGVVVGEEVVGNEVGSCVSTLGLHTPHVTGQIRLISTGIASGSFTSHCALHAVLFDHVLQFISISFKISPGSSAHGGARTLRAVL